jgi:CRISPR-associated protein Csb1
MSKLTDFDHWLTDDKFAALTARQPLESVDGPDGIIFPPTFAAAEGAEGEKGDYNIDYFDGEFIAKIGYRHPADEEVNAEVSHASGGNVCLINSVGAEANRVEPLFRPDKGGDELAKLVPQVRIKAGRQTINLLDAGHRAGDAIIRFTKLGERIFDAFRALLETGNAELLAKVAPTSLVFGVWDSRGTQAKLPRVFRSVVRAYNVKRVTRSAQFNRAIKYVENGLIDEKLDKGSGDNNPLSREGFKDNPAPGSPGGVIVTGELRRDMTINLSAIRRLRVPDVTDTQKTDAEKTLRLRRYVLGLALVAATARNEERFDLREGCQLRVTNRGAIR